MDVTFIANDTRGGVDPYLALAEEARSRGHFVRIVAPPQYRTAFPDANASFTALRGAEAARSVALEAELSMREMARRVEALTAEWAVETASAVQGTDAVLAGIGGLALGRPVARAVGATFVRAHLQPLDAPSAKYPGPLAPRLDVFGPLARRFSHAITATGTNVLTRAPERAARRALGLGDGRADELTTILYGFSNTVVPVESDAKVTRIPTGYWTMRAKPGVTSVLEDFVARGGPIVSIGFGSMVSHDPARLRALVTDAARRAGVRAVLLTGWGALEASDTGDDQVLAVPSVAHSWLFPRMDANVHHGGAGTTGAAMIAAKPQVIVPFGADQPFWAQRAHTLGVAPRPIAYPGLTTERLVEAIESALSHGRLLDRAEHVGALLAQEHGTRTAIDAIERAVPRHRRGSPA